MTDLPPGDPTESAETQWLTQKAESGFTATSSLAQMLYQHEAALTEAGIDMDALSTHLCTILYTIGKLYALAHKGGWNLEDVDL